MAKKKGRYFYRNNGAHLLEESPTVETVAVQQNDPVSVELPQNSLSIPAMVSASTYQGFLFGLYSIITFLSMIVLVFTWMKPPAVSSLPAYDLIHKPASAESHLKYMEWLVTNYRLVDAEQENLFVTRARSRGWYKDLDVTRFQALQQETRHKQEIFRSLVSEYAYWHRINKEYPNYRDGLYRASQLSYMLLNDVESERLLENSVSLDPQFKLAAEADSKLEK